MRQLQAAYETVRDKLSSGVWSPGARMPALAELAELCTVSRGTMWKALSRLRDENLLHTRRRGSIFAGSAEAVTTKARPRGLLWERTKILLGKEILAGAFPELRLPPVNKLARRYGVTAHTTSKALEQLVQEGILVADGRKYCRSRSGVRSTQPPIILISAGTRERGILVTDPRTQSITESFERECSRLGHSCRSLGYNVFSATARIDIESNLRELPEPAGFVVNIWNPRNETYWNRWVDLLHWLTARGLPTIVIDQSGDLPCPDPLTRSPWFRVLRIASERAGAMVADFLSRRGHTRIAYVTPYYSQDWSKNRHAGLCRYFQEYGSPECNVEHFTLSELADSSDLRCALLGLNERELMTLYADRLEHKEMDTLRATLDRISALGLPELFRNDPTATMLHGQARSLIRRLRSGNAPESCSALLATTVHLADVHSMRVYVNRFLTEILKKTTSSAWVCSEENTALNALSFLRSQGRLVPQEISIMGFDNWKEAHEQDLSTYDFNMDGLVKEALLMIMDDTHRKATPVIGEVDGYVVERGTTRR